VRTFSIPASLNTSIRRRAHLRVSSLATRTVLLRNGMSGPTLSRSSGISLSSICEGQGWIDDSPARKLKPLSVEKGNRTAIFSDEQYAKILDAVSQYDPENVPQETRKAWQRRITTFIELLRWSGMAIVDAVLFRPDSMDADGVLRYRRQKTDELATIPLPDHVVEKKTFTIIHRLAAVRSLPNFQVDRHAVRWDGVKSATYSGRCFGGIVSSQLKSLPLLVTAFVSGFTCPNIDRAIATVPLSPSRVVMSAMYSATASTIRTCFDSFSARRRFSSCIAGSQLSLHSFACFSASIHNRFLQLTLRFFPLPSPS
jgi:hypothetical protein